MRFFILNHKYIKNINNTFLRVVIMPQPNLSVPWNVVKKDPRLDLPKPDQNFHGKTGAAFGTNKSPYLKSNFTSTVGDPSVGFDDDLSYGEDINAVDFNSTNTGTSECTPKEFQEYQQYLDAGGSFDVMTESSVGDKPPPVLSQEYQQYLDASDSENTENIGRPVQSDNPLMRGNPIIHGTPLRPTHGLKETRPTHGLKETRPTHGLKETRITHGLKETRPTHDLKETGNEYLRGRAKEGMLPPPRGGGYILRDSESQYLYSSKDDNYKHVYDIVTDDFIYNKPYNMSVVDISSGCDCSAAEDKVPDNTPKNCGGKRGPKGEDGDRGVGGPHGFPYHIGCGLEVINNFIQVKTEDIAGAGLEFDSCELSVDNIVDDSKTIFLQNISDISLGCINGNIVLNFTNEGFNIKFNEAGNVIDFEENEPEPVTSAIDLCDCECTPSSSSSGSGGGTICCNIDTELQLIATFGGCASGSCTLTYNASATPFGGAFGAWEGVCDEDPLGDGSEIALTFYCTGSIMFPGTSCHDYILTMELTGGTCVGVTGHSAPTSCTCDPLNIVFPRNFSGYCGDCGNQVFTVTITEAP
jgi:hypothetical protein